MRDLPKQLADLIPSDAMKSPLLAPFSELSRRRLERRTARELTDRAKQIYASPRGAGICEAARLSRDGLHSRLPGNYRREQRCRMGAAAYAFHVRWQTTTKLDAAADSRNRAGRGGADSRRDGTR